MTRARTRGSLSTRTAMACRSRSATPGVSNENHALLRYRLLGLVFGAKEHLVVSRTGRDHREAVLRLIDHDIEYHGTIDRQHFPDRRIEISRALDPQPDRAKRLRQLDEVGECGGVALGVAAAMQQLLPLPYHAHVLVVD